MEALADGLMIMATLGAAMYCFVLARRLKRLMALDDGIGASIATLSQQVDGLQNSLQTTKKVTGASAEGLRDMTARAEIAAGRLELLLAALHHRDEVSRSTPKPAVSQRESLVANLRDVTRAMK